MTRSTLCWVAFCVAYVSSIIAQSYAADTACLTLQQARVQFPKDHLYWHGRNHCWDNQGGAPHSVVKKNPLSLVPDKEVVQNSHSPERLQTRQKQQLGLQPDKTKPQQMTAGAETILWPTLKQSSTVADIRFWTTKTEITRWPLLLDVDMITSDRDPPDACCWPILEINFEDRWSETNAIKRNSVQQ